MATGVAATMQITIMIMTVIIMMLMFVMRTAMLIEPAAVRDRLYYSVRGDDDDDDETPW